MIRLLFSSYNVLDLPGGSDGKASACNMGDSLTMDVFKNFIPLVIQIGGVLQCVCGYAQSLRLCLTLCDPMNQPTRLLCPCRFSRQEYWSGFPCPPPGDLPSPGPEPGSLISPTLAGGFFTTSVTWEVPQHAQRLLKIQGLPELRKGVEQREMCMTIKEQCEDLYGDT